MAKKLKLSMKQMNELNDHLKNQFRIYEDLRQDFDDEILEEVDLYNDIDKHMQPWDKNLKIGKMWWEAKGTVPYGYTIVQTMVTNIFEFKGSSTCAPAKVATQARRPTTIVQ